MRNGRNGYIEGAGTLGSDGGTVVYRGMALAWHSLGNRWIGIERRRREASGTRKWEGSSAATVETGEQNMKRKVILYCRLGVALRREVALGCGRRGCWH